MFQWFTGKRFEAPAHPLRDYWLTVHVTLEEPLVSEGHAPSVGYLRILGVRCEPLRLHSFVDENTPDGTVRWTKTEVAPVDINAMGRSLRNQIDPVAAECMWHASGKIYFPAERATGSLGPTPVVR
jgi:hypothetical protein